MRKLLALVALLWALPAQAQIGPTPVWGLQLKSQSPIIGLSPASQAIIQYNSTAGQTWLSQNGSAYQWMIAINTSPVPGTSNVVYWNGSTWVAQQLTQDDIGTAFTVSLAASGFATVQQCGATITNPQFTLTRNQVPVTASLTDANAGLQSFTATLTTIGYAGAANTFGGQTYTVTSVNGTKTWTLTMTNAGSITKTASVVATFEVHLYYGMAVPGTINSAFITGLSNNNLSTISIPKTITYAAGGNTMSAYFAIPATFTSPTNFTDTGTGFGIPFSQVGTNVSVTNECGTGNNVLYNVFASDQLLNAGFSGQWH